MPALVTPFDAAGDFDAAAHSHNVGLLTARGIGGFVLAGSTGEGPYLEAGERSRIVAVARDHAPDAYLVCGVNGETLRAAAAQTAEAADAGADAVLVITPTTLVRSRHREVEGFYADLADTAALPIFLYTVPRVTGYELPVDVIVRLGAHPNIAGVKDSGGDVERLVELGATMDPSFLVFVGASRAVRDGMEAGAHGAVTASGNYAWPLLQALVADGATGEPQEALTAVASFVDALGVPGAKQAARLVGLRSGLPRRPLLPVHPSRHRQLCDALTAAGLLEPRPAESA
jgi:dihydrodipicolinate synthase/N-acetylneuraminate lyase